MTINALNLDGGADFSVKLGIAVHVLDEVAVDAVHSLLEVDVELMDGQPVALCACGPVKCGQLFGRGIFCAIPLLELVGHPYRGHQGRRRIVGDRLAAVVEQLAMPVFLEDRAKDPAVAMIVSKLRVFRLWVQVGDPLQKRRVRPLALRRRLVRVRHHRAGELLGGRMFLFLGVHQLAVGLFVPPHVASVRIEDICTRVDMTDNALAGGDGQREPVLDRVARLVGGDGGVALEARAVVAEDRVRPRVDPGAVVGIDHVAAGAAARAIVARVVVGPEEVERRVEQPGFLQAKEHGVGAVARAQAANAQAGLGLTRILERVGDADLLRFPPAALEDPQDVTGLRGFVPWQRVEVGHDAFEG